ncbi:hypothetical protein N7474_003137 [Penicillium riverlandense]|uniref:uncharacterized protein n=1 Tax=Penicillium riverlandense TaxID=1903569 RepID=UPI002546E097|nr:uncharacterized protein N7474_003137 [Penicillium riverlandense]KAJ5825999.1 hypothetical protein N7474_003137 [Penicillium riverlandense]
MDPLSLAASLAGVITTSTQILGIINTVNSKNNEELDSLSREVTAVRAILFQIQRIIQLQSAKPTKSSEWLEALNDTLDDCGDLYLGLQKELQGLSYHSKFDALKKKIKWTLKEKNILETLRKLESYKLSLDLLLSVQTSTTTSNIEDILVQVQKKLSLKSAESPAVQTPLSWRKNLAGFVAKPAQTQNQNNSAAFSDTQSAYGINQDEGADAPDLNSPDLTSVCEIEIGHQTISLICGWEESSINAAIKPIRAHILFKGPSQSDLYFLQLGESLSNKLIERFVVPVGNLSLIIARCDGKNSACLLDDLATRDNCEDFQLSVDKYALQPSLGTQQILVNFESAQDGTERSYIYPYLDIDYSVSNEPPRLTCRTKPNGTAVIFREDLSTLHMEIVSTETVLCTTPGGKTISATFGSLNELVQTFYRLRDAVEEWRLLNTKGLDDYETKAEWELGSFEFLENLGSREFQESSKSQVSPFCMVRAVAKSDRVYKRLKIDIFDEKTSEKLASCFVVLSAVLFHKKHFRRADPKFFTIPMFVAGFWDLRNGGTETPDNFRAGQVRMHTSDDKKTCEELEELVETIIEGTRDAQKRFLCEVGRV